MADDGGDPSSTRLAFEGRTLGVRKLSVPESGAPRVGIWMQGA
jgi:hypothetical protein